ncbi:hypothetical protein OBBRIDRAFT_528663 [Obba rivulosa]|uniref:Uncharacterized protein n=1 Tax=Obba rivulosa TaxID=1052685 RepID=A0A8E2AUM3_9APHY|nr:hypothetical protein OBBRIDRAFT_528663 [Obba rivulosa]
MGGKRQLTDALSQPALSLRLMECHTKNECDNLVGLKNARLEPTPAVTASSSQKSVALFAAAKNFAGCLTTRESSPAAVVRLFSILFLACLSPFVAIQMSWIRYYC